MTNNKTGLQLYTFVRNYYDFARADHIAFHGHHTASAVCEPELLHMNCCVVLVHCQRLFRMANDD